MNTSYKRVERIKEFMKWEGLSQEQLGEIVGENGIAVKQQNVSRAFRSGQIKEEWCEAIIKKYPKYRIQWLMGYDDYPTHKDVVVESGMDAEKMEKAFPVLFDLAGYEMIQAKGDGSLEGIFKAMRTFATLRKGGRSITMSLADLNAFENEIIDYIDFRLQHI